ncbi:MAG TPA: NAD-dependent epimerase/dehydratase family protein [Vicinamibacterales bacterium]|jgi:nucleoside-diphosphate-sugar epimerase|nr:NAD-dependent epimerase/dehydratase family protein [Vicinamibacterales bacterium]
MSRWYAGRPVLVLGGLGFLGVNVSRTLLERESRLTIVTRSRGRHAESAARFESSGARVVEADVRDASAMCRVVRNQDVIFNLSGQSGAVASMDDPWTDLDVNCRGNLTVLEALRTENGAAAHVFAGSRLEYGRPLTTPVGPVKPVGEDAAMQPLCLHAVHKIAVEHYLHVYRRVYRLRSTVARLTNPYGPGQPEERVEYGVVNRLVHLALENKALPIYGNGSQARDYIYIDDAVDALLALGASEASNGHAYNVGTGVGIRLADMARRITEHAGGGRLEFVPWPAMAERIETGDFVADVARIAADVGWRPRVDLDEGLRRTVAFYRSRAIHS